MSVRKRRDNTKYYRTPKGLAHKLYGQLRARSKRRGHDLPSYGLPELYEWIIDQPGFESQMLEWKESGYHTQFIPSIDRIDNRVGYEFENMRLLPWGEHFKATYGLLDDPIEGTKQPEVERKEVVQSNKMDKDQIGQQFSIHIENLTINITQ